MTIGWGEFSVNLECILSAKRLKNNPLLKKTKCISTLTDRQIVLSALWLRKLQSLIDKNIMLKG